MLIIGIQAHRINKAEAIQIGHIEVGDHQVNLPAIKMFERIFAIDTGQRCIPFLLQGEPDHLNYKIGVVNNQYGFVHTIIFGFYDGQATSLVMQPAVLSTNAAGNGKTYRPHALNQVVTDLYLVIGYVYTKEVDAGQLRQRDKLLGR
jgi:hypothetical protein